MSNDYISVRGLRASFKLFNLYATVLFFFNLAFFVTPCTGVTALIAGAVAMPFFRDVITSTCKGSFALSFLLTVLMPVVVLAHGPFTRCPFMLGYAILVGMLCAVILSFASCIKDIIDQRKRTDEALPHPLGEDTYL